MNAGCPRCGHGLPSGMALRFCPECGMAVNWKGSERDEDGQPVNRAFNATRLAERSLDELIGLSKMALLDGKITQEEAEYILGWMQANADAAGQWPASVIYPRLQQMLSDDHLDADEQAELFDLLADLVGGSVSPYNARNHSTRLPLDDPQPRIRFSGSKFCFTAKFCYGTRRTCQEAVASLGGVPIDGIRKDLNYLVVGIIGSTDWIHSTHGRKIEQAIEYRDDGYPLAIVSEEHWVQCLQASL